MTREECEKRIEQKLREIDQIVQQYNPGNNYLDLSILDGAMSFCNEHWESERPIRVNNVQIERENDDELS